MNARASGFTLAELLVVTVLGGIALTAAYQTLAVQERSYRHQRARVSTQQAGRTTLEMVRAELREISAEGGDLILATPESLTIRAPRKLGFICQTTDKGKVLDIWVLGSEPFVKSDELLIFADGDTLTRQDDSWAQVKINSIATGACPVAWGGYPMQEIKVPPTDTIDVKDVRRGGEIRAFEELTYGLYEIDGQWMLGRHRSGSRPVPLVGPLASGPEDGLRFAYFDTTGVQKTTFPLTAGDRASINLIKIWALGKSRAHVGPDQQQLIDTMATQLYLRNN